MAAVSVAAIAGFSLRSVTASPAAPMAPAAAVVGVVELERLINGLTELKARNDSLGEKTRKWSDEIQTLKAQVEKLDADLKELPPSNREQRTALGVERFEKGKLLETKQGVYRELLAMDQGQVIRDLYLKAVSAANEYAEANSFDLVMMDDRVIDLPDGGSNEQYNNIIRSKRVLYARKTLDITDALMTLMNNQYAAGQNAPANSSAGPGAAGPR